MATAVGISLYGQLGFILYFFMPLIVHDSEDMTGSEVGRVPGNDIRPDLNLCPRGDEARK